MPQRSLSFGNGGGPRDYFNTNLNYTNNPTPTTSNGYGVLGGPTAQSDENTGSHTTGQQRTYAAIAGSGAPGGLIYYGKTYQQKRFQPPNSSDSPPISATPGGRRSTFTSGSTYDEEKSSGGRFDGPLSDTNLYIRGLSPSTTDEELRKMCEPFGTIVSTKAIIDKSTNQCKGYGFVDFETAEAAKEAVNSLAGQNVHAQMAKQQEQDPTNLYIANLPPSFNEIHLEELLNEHGTVISTRVLRNADTSSRCVGFARMDSRECCDAIISKFNGKVLEGATHPLVVKLADSGRKPKRSISSATNGLIFTDNGSRIDLMPRGIHPRGGSLGSYGYGQTMGGQGPLVAPMGNFASPMDARYYYQNYAQPPFMTVGHPQQAYPGSMFPSNPAYQPYDEINALTNQMQHGMSLENNPSTTESGSTPSSGATPVQMNPYGVPYQQYPPYYMQYPTDTPMPPPPNGFGNGGGSVHSTTTSSSPYFYSAPPTNFGMNSSTVGAPHSGVFSSPYVSGVNATATSAASTEATGAGGLNEDYVDVVTTDDKPAHGKESQETTARTSPHSGEQTTKQSSPEAN